MIKIYECPRWEEHERLNAESVYFDNEGLLLPRVRCTNCNGLKNPFENGPERLCKVIIEPEKIRWKHDRHIVQKLAKRIRRQKKKEARRQS